MKELLFEAVFEYHGYDGSIYDGTIPHLKDAMEHELVRCYNLYANVTNAGLYEELNAKFSSDHPGYFEDLGKDWDEMAEYNRYIASECEARVCKPMNDRNESPLLRFGVDPKEVNFYGYLKNDPSVRIEFFLKPTK